MPVIGAKVQSNRRPPMPLRGGPTPPAFPPPGFQLLPLAPLPPKACSKNKLGPQPPPCTPLERLLLKRQAKSKEPPRPPPERLLHKDQQPPCPPPERLLHKRQINRKQRLVPQPPPCPPP